MALIMVVFPVPGPPVMMTILFSKAFIIASFCFGLYVSAAIVPSSKTNLYVYCLTCLSYWAIKTTDSVKTLSSLSQPTNV